MIKLLYNGVRGNSEDQRALAQQLKENDIITEEENGRKIQSRRIDGQVQLWETENRRSIDDKEDTDREELEYVLDIIRDMV